jgi:hypothetical protein
LKPLFPLNWQAFSAVLQLQNSRNIAPALVLQQPQPTAAQLATLCSNAALLLQQLLAAPGHP